MEKTEYLQATIALLKEIKEGIHDAAQQGDLVKIKRLLEKSPELLEARSENEKTPLHFAAQGGHKDIVELLIAREPMRTPRIWIEAVYNTYKDKQEESFTSEPNLIAIYRIEAVLHSFVMRV